MPASPPSWCLLPALSSSPTFLGGTPYHPWGEGEVRYQGKPSHLLVQVALSALPALPPLPAGGYLQVFYLTPQGEDDLPSLFLGRVLSERAQLSREELPPPSGAGRFLLSPEERVPLTVEKREAGGGELYLKEEELQLSRTKHLLLGSYGGHFLQVPGAWWGGFLPLTLTEELTPLRSLLL